MSTTDRPIPFHPTLPTEADDVSFGEPNSEIRTAEDAAEGDKRAAGEGASPLAGLTSADDAGAQAPEGASNELAASLTDRLIQFWRTGEMGDGEFLPDEFYDKGAQGAGGSHPDNEDTTEGGASVLDFLPRRGPLPELRNAKQRQNSPGGSQGNPNSDDAFAVPGFGMFAPSADPFSGSPSGNDEGRPVLKPSSNAGHAPDAEFTNPDSGLWGRSETIPRRDDDGAFGGAKNSDRILGLDGSRARDGETPSVDTGRRSSPTMRMDSLWGGDTHDSLSNHNPAASHMEPRREPHGGGHNAFERIAPDNQFGSDDRHFGEGFEMYREPAPISDRQQTKRLPTEQPSSERLSSERLSSERLSSERLGSERNWDGHQAQSQDPEQPQSRRGPLPRQNAPVVTQEERPTVKRKPVLEVAFIYGSALALAAAVMGAIYLSNEGRLNRLGQPGQQAGMSGMNGMNGMTGANGMNGMSGMNGMNGMYGPNSMAGNVGPSGYALPQHAQGGVQRGFEVHDVVGFPARPIALSIVLPKPLSDADAFLSIGGLPDGAQLSAGTRMASGFWMLRFEDIEGLTLKLPESAPAEIQAEAAILRQDGAKSFERNFRISTANQGRASAPEAAAQPERAPAAAGTAMDLPKMAPDAEKALLGRSNVLLEQGDISAARLMLEHGAIKGCVECGFKLAQICDPLYLSKLDVWGVQPDIEKALRWYAWSARYGHPKASEAHGKLKQKILSDVPGN